jgi:murein DD-endopeptidase MepM/ murein hydrolase activator NlpD
VRKDASRFARVFASGAGVGFVAGAFVVSLIVWRYGNVIGSSAARRSHPPATPGAVERLFDPSDGLDDAGDGIVSGQPAPVATTGAEPSPVVRPPAPPEPVLAAAPARELMDRDLLIPVEGVKPDQLSRTFRDPRSGGRTHEAIDILAPMHTPVLAAEEGTIARLFYSQAGGITIYQFDPTERFCYYYAHLNRYAEGLREGQRVNKGQVIGYVGVSGNAPKNTPHLHFAIFRLTDAKRWWEGTPLDPYDVLK